MNVIKRKIYTIREKKIIRRQMDNWNKINTNKGDAKPFDLLGIPLIILR